MKKCTKCGASKSLDEYGFRTIKSVRYTRNECKPCRVEVRKKIRLERREEFLVYKKTLSCVNCGHSDYRVLDFHHANDDKDKGVSELVQQGYSMEKIMAEVSKCEVLCANCHRVEHSED